MYDTPPWSPPPHPRPPPNGSHAWPPPSRETDIYLRIAEDLGALKQGMRQSLANDGEIFGQIHEIRDRVRALEVRPQAPLAPPSPPATPQQLTTAAPETRGLLHGLTAFTTALSGLVTAVKELLPGAKELIVIAVIIAAALGRIEIPAPLLAMITPAK